MFCRDFNEAKGDKSNIKSIMGSVQVFYYAEVDPLGGRELAVKYVNEGEGHVQEGC